MCLNPVEIKPGEFVACRYYCWQCSKDRVDDWVGRCIAENETVACSSSLTLTYGKDEDGNSDHWHAAVLIYEDVQNFFKRLRAHGYPCRYFAVGEFGSKKARAHWHVLVFWLDSMPAFKAGELLVTPHNSGEKMRDGDAYPVGENFMERHWTHGWSHWGDFGVHNIRYVCKYLLKDQKDPEKQGHLAMSKKPPLGAAYFAQLAGRFVDQGLAPQDGRYSFPEIRRSGGRRTKNGGAERVWRKYEFLLSHKSLDLFCQSFVDQWADRRGGYMPASPFLEEWLDKQARRDVDQDWQPSRVRSKGVAVFPSILAPEGFGDVAFSETHNSFVCSGDGKRLFWSFNERGERAWRNVILSEADGARLRAEAERLASPGRYKGAKDPGM